MGPYFRGPPKVGPDLLVQPEHHSVMKLGTSAPGTRGAWAVTGISSVVARAGGGAASCWEAAGSGAPETSTAKACIGGGAGGSAGVAFAWIACSGAASARSRASPVGIGGGVGFFNSSATGASSGTSASAAKAWARS